MQFERADKIEIDKPLGGVDLAWYPVCHFPIPVARTINKPYQIHALDGVVVVEESLWQPMGAFVIDLTNLYGKATVFRIKQKPIILRVAQGFQSVFEDGDPAGNKAEADPRRTVIPGYIYILFLC